jgi:Protein of unknown function (DUF2786)
MGKSNRQRRKAKARKRAAPRRRPAGRPRGEAPPPPSDLLHHLLDRATDIGWTADDLDRIVARKLGRAEAALLAALRAGEPLTQTDAAARLGALLAALPQLPKLVDADGPAGDPELLRRVRALLAKAESTEFDAEAEALTAKAQELMARHRIDRATLIASDGGDEVVGRRIWIDDPYADAKAILLGGVASANGARAVWSKGVGFSTVFGYAEELAGVEELFTSLLVQATAALRREGSKVDDYGRNRTKRFRRSFLVAYAYRIRERLHEAVDRTVDEMSNEAGTDLVPILAARDEAVDDAFDAAFPDTESFSPSVSDREGVLAGRFYADLADLSAGPTLGERSA